MFYFCRLKKLVRPETFGPFYIERNSDNYTSHPLRLRWVESIAWVLRNEEPSNFSVSRGILNILTSSRLQRSVRIYVITYVCLLGQTRSEYRILVGENTLKNGRTDGMMIFQMSLVRQILNLEEGEDKTTVVSSG